MEPDKREMNIGLIGFGTVGTAVYQILLKSRTELLHQTGVDLKVTRVAVRDLSKPRVISLPPGVLTDDATSLALDPDIDILVEVVGSADLKPLLLRAMAAGKAVITANKELIADHGPELFEAAEKNNVDLLFEGSVGGGIPILRPLKETLAAGRIRRIMGIVNGTTNFILSQMARAGKSFEEALAEAQAVGFAEADPTADVDGHDAARKLAILATIAFHSRVTTRDVYVEGIRRITPDEIAYGKQRGWALKLSGDRDRTNNRRCHHHDAGNPARPARHPGHHQHYSHPRIGLKRNRSQSLGPQIWTDDGY